VNRGSPEYHAQLRFAADNIHEELIGKSNPIFRMKNGDDVMRSEDDEYRDAETIVALLAPRDETGAMILGPGGRPDIGHISGDKDVQRADKMTRKGLDLNNPRQLAYLFPDRVSDEETNPDVLRARNVGLAARAGDADGYRTAGTRFADMPQSLINDVMSRISIDGETVHGKLSTAGIRAGTLVPGTKTEVRLLPNAAKKAYMQQRGVDIFSQWMRQGGTNITHSDGRMYAPNEGGMAMDHIDPYSKSIDVLGSSSSFYSDPSSNFSLLETHENSSKGENSIQETQRVLNLSADLQQRGITSFITKDDRGLDWMEGAQKLLNSGVVAPAEIERLGNAGMNNMLNQLRIN